MKNRINKVLNKIMWKSRHNGKVKTLTKDVQFVDGSSWPKSWKVRICGVSFLGVRVQALGIGKFATGIVGHNNIKW